MFEKYAYILLNEYASYLAPSFYALVIIPGIVAIIADRGDGKLRRTPYFSMGCAAILAVYLVGLSWVWSIDAILGGYVWCLVAINALAAVALGVVLGKIAGFRSRDAFGNRVWAFLVFVPLANLWLLFKRSRQEPGPVGPVVSFFSGGSGVILGFVLAVAGGFIAVAIDPLGTGRIEAAQKESDFEAKSMTIKLGHYGLEDALKQFGQDDGFPVEINEFTKLTGMVSDGSVLRRNFAVSVNGATVLLPTEAESAAYACENAGLSQILAAGGTIRDIYVADDGRQMADYSITEMSCSS